MEFVFFEFFIVAHQCCGAEAVAGAARSRLLSLMEPEPALLKIHSIFYRKGVGAGDA
jgi:hypothetical protein